MNKIFLLKMLIAFITFLIFLTLGGIVYALVNYKTTPKLFSRKKADVVVQTVQPEKEQPAPAAIPEISLGLKKGESIESGVSCGELICLKIKSDFEGNKIILFDPASLRIRATLTAREAAVSK